MSKKLLKNAAKNLEQRLVEFSKQSGLEVGVGGVRVGKFLPGNEELLHDAEKAGDTGRALELMDRSIENNASELYFGMPDLHLSDKGSVKLLKVSMYSAAAKDDVLLHKLFGKVRG